MASPTVDQLQTQVTTLQTQVVALQSANVTMNAWCVRLQDFLDNHTHSTYGKAQR